MSVQRGLEAALDSRQPWSEAMLLLLETVNQQSTQIRRLEDIVAAQVFPLDQSQQQCGPQQPQSLSISLAHGLESTQQQLQELQGNCTALEQQQQQAMRTSKASADKLQQLEQRVKQLEQQGQQVQQHLGLPGRSHQSRAAAAGSGQCEQLDQHEPSLAARLSAAATCPSTVAASSIAGRLQRLEQQMECLAGSAADVQEQLHSAASGVSVLDAELARQLANIRTDTKQAITVATSRLRSELEAAADSKAKEQERQLKHELEGMSTRLDSRLSSCRLAVSAALTGEIDARLSAAHEASQGRLDDLQDQLERLADSKADMLLLTQYTEQVTEVFEQLSSTVVDNTKAGIADLVDKQQQLRSIVQGLSANKADSSALLQHQQQCQQQLLELQRDLAAVHRTTTEAAAAALSAKRAVEPVDGLRLDLASTQGCVAALQAATAGLEATSSGNSSHLQEQARQMQDLASSYHMLQQQLVALTNQIDPSAATILAAAAAGDTSIAHYQPFAAMCDREALTSTLFLDHDSAAAAAAGSSSDGNDLQRWLSISPEASEPGAARGNSSSKQPPAAAALAAIRAAQEAGGAGSGGAGGGVLRHLPVAMRLQLLEGSLQELSSNVTNKAAAGDVHALSAAVEGLSGRVAATSDSLRGLSAISSKRLEEQASCISRITASLASSMEDRPTSAQVHELLQQTLADAQEAASRTATAAGKAAVQSLQQQLEEVWAELETVKGQLQAAKQELGQLKDWKLTLGDHQQHLQHQAHLLRQQLAQQLQEQQQDMQQQLESSSREVAADAVKQMMADQAAMQGDAKTGQRLAAFDTKLRLLVAEVDRLDRQTAQTVQLQDKQTDALAALESALAAHSSKCTADAQQLHTELTAALSDAGQAQSEAEQAQADRLAALEASAKGQAAAVAELAGLVASLPSKAGIREAVVGGTQATVELLLKEHKQEEEERWEVWLSEFARVLEQRPTTSQVQQQLAKQQQQLHAACKEAAAGLAEAAAARALAAALDEGLGTQLKVLDMRVDTLEEGLQGLGAAAAGPQQAQQQQHGVTCSDGVSAGAAGPQAAAAAAAGAAYSAGQLALLLRQVGDVQLQLLSKVDRSDVEQQLLGLRQQLHDFVTRDELDDMLVKKLDIETFLASVAARQAAARAGS